MLETFIETNPADPFPRYSLALECMSNLGDYERAQALFGSLVTEHPSYVATYLMYGNLLTQHLGEPEKAREILAHGIDVAREAGDSHAASELTAALAELGKSA